eukprot:12260840-Heterocapsa_arctica.AAC.1
MLPSAPLGGKSDGRRQRRVAVVPADGRATGALAGLAKAAHDTTENRCINCSTPPAQPRCREAAL